MAHQQPNQQPAAHHFPFSKHPQPASAHQQQASPHQQPALAPQHPAAVNQQPIVAHHISQHGAMAPQQQYAVVAQPMPGAVLTMPVPAAIPGCPPGLEYLTQVDHLIVNQLVEMVEILLNFETNNRYVVRNALGQQIYFAAEETDCCNRYFCGKNRAFEMAIVDNFGRRVMHISRNYGCAMDPCCACLPFEMVVMAPPGVVVGMVREDCACCTPSFGVTDASGQRILTVTGPCNMCLCIEVDFPILAADGVTQVGNIRKHWGGFVKEYFSDADNFGVSFPLDLDVKMKATLLGACFMIDFRYFERSGNQK